MRQILASQVEALRSVFLANEKEGKNTHWEVGDKLNQLVDIVASSLEDDDQKKLLSLIGKLNFKRPSKDDPAVYLIKSQLGRLICD